MHPPGKIIYRSYYRVKCKLVSRIAYRVKKDKENKLRKTKEKVN